jgi:hypothetical protein
MNWNNCETGPLPLPEQIAKAYNYGIFSARTGNIYTARQLLAWAQLAVARPDQFPEPEFWEDGSGVRDSLRPVIEPKPFVSLTEARASRAEAVGSFRRSVLTSDVFLFTLGLTEGWENRETGQPYAMCPGTIEGKFNPDLHVLLQYRFDMLLRQYSLAFAVFRKIKPDLKIILTVSPVSPVATQSGQHILVAAMHTKSLLRAVASELVQTHPFIDYFPSYELVASPAARGIFYSPNMRTIAPLGVDFVMGHFFKGLDASGPAVHAQTKPPATPTRPVPTNADFACEEVALEIYADDKT